MTTDFWASTESNLLRFRSYAELVENIYMKAILDSFQRLKAVVGINTFIENKIRNHLAHDLENYNPILKPFLELKVLKLTKENTLLLSPDTTNRTDIELFISGHGDFVIECKNLKSAEQRYINDGLHRFTSGSYATKDSEAGMIGFIVGGSIISIVKGIASKIKADPSYIISVADANCNGYIESFHSTHSRAKNDNIYIHHLFVDLNDAS